MVDSWSPTTFFEPLGAREARVGAHGGEVLQHGGLRVRPGPLAVQRQGEGNLGKAWQVQQEWEKTSDASDGSTSRISR